MTLQNVLTYIYIELRPTLQARLKRLFLYSHSSGHASVSRFYIFHNRSKDNTRRLTSFKC